MNEQQLQQAYTRHCETTGQTKTTRTGFEDFKAGFRLAQPAAGEAVEIEAPTFHHVAMACGLEDRGITDRYEAMEYGYNEALEQQWTIINSHGPLFAAPPAATPVAAGEPVAWRFQTCSGGRWHVTTNKMHARIFEGTEDGGQVQELFAVAPPAAAHGDEAVQFAIKNLVAVARTIDKEAFAKGTQNVPHGHFRSLDYALQSYDAAMRAQGDGGEA